MLITTTPLLDCVVIEPKVFIDARGFFLETFQDKRYKEMAGIELPFVQANQSHSVHGVLRGLHFQKTKPQGKLIQVLRGEVFDVAVDLRSESQSFSQWYGIILSEENKRQVWIPPGMAHGYVVLSELADLEYKCTQYYDPTDEGTIIWNDPDLAIDWPIDSPVLSDKDASGENFNQLFNR